MIPPTRQNGEDSAVTHPRAAGGQTHPRVSVVIPLHNEAHTLRELHARVAKTMAQQNRTWELVLVNDGSTDGTGEILESLLETEPRLTVVELRRNYGQTPALKAGFDHACGEIVVSLDGDLQHAPEEIPGFIDKIEEGYDLVSGWRVSRSDALLTRKVPSRIANWLMAYVSGVQVHDFGTTFKAYRRDILEDIHLYGDLHRFVPALSAMNGARIAEIPIKDMGRSTGKSHYGLSRTFRVMFDLLTVGFLLRYLTRPLHLFGKLSLACIGPAGLIALFLLGRKVIEGVHLFHEHGPLLVLAAVLLLAGMQFLSIGLLGEIQSRTYFETQNKRIYSVRTVKRRQPGGAASDDFEK